MEAETTGADTTTGDVSSSSTAAEETMAAGDSSTGEALPPDMGEPEPEGLNGTYLLAFSSTLQPGLAFQFRMSIVDDDSGTVDLEFEPLTLDVGSSTEPREPSGVIYEYPAVPVLFGDQPSMRVVMGEIEIPGEANPITGAPVTVDLTLNGTFDAGGRYCGMATGMVTMPIATSLMGSDFAAVRVPSLDELPDAPSLEDCEG